MALVSKRSVLIKDHAAMMHYQSTEESDVDVKAEGMLLIDSGGQYYGGTTDVTRTFYSWSNFRGRKKILYTGIKNLC